MDFKTGRTKRYYNSPGIYHGLWKTAFDIYIVNTGKTVHTMLELDDEIIVNRLLRG